RWRFVNAANGRYFNLRIPGARFLVIGSDGGLLAQPYGAETLLVTPGERYDVLVTFERNAGRPAALETVHYDRGHDIPDPGPQELLRITYAAAVPAPAPLPDTWGQAPRLPITDSTLVR